MKFEVIPAIDLRGGRVVRLKQGDYSRETHYEVDAGSLAEMYAGAGARWVHVVDLDGALAGRFANLETIEAIARKGMRVQAGGGVREEADLRRMFDAGVARAVVGSVAVRGPQLAVEWLRIFGAERIVIALDSRFENGRWTLPVAGWGETSACTLDEFVPWYAARGARHLLCTDIARDGMLSGCDAGLYRRLAKLAPGAAVQASGGVRSPGDLRALREAGAGAAILGRAILEGRFTLGEALEAAETTAC